MRKIFFMVGALLAVVSSSVMAEWIQFDDVGDFASYANLATIRASGAKVKIWSLLDYKTAQTVEGITFLTMKKQEELDCQEKQYRILALSFHTGNMGKGRVLFSNSVPQKWKPVPPDSVTEALLEIACRKR